jgi:hypothetical protein
VIESNLTAGKFSLLDLAGLAPHRLLEITIMPPEEITFLFKNVNEKRDLSG